ncbi:MAG: hypothetical protein WC502_04605 [Methanolinea sp.]|jgi:uncharacterized membrane protein
MTSTIYSHFHHELNSFFLVTLLNVVFGALAMAFGIQYIVASVLGLTYEEPLSLIRIVTAAISMVGFGLGLSWMVSSVEIMDGIDDIRNFLKENTTPVSDEITTCGIVRMIAHYRGHRKTIRTMILVCTIGGFCFLALGIISSIEFFSFSLMSGTITLNSYLLIPSVLLALSVALVSLASSFYFSKFSRAWDLREDEISRAEHELAETLGRDLE